MDSLLASGDQEGPLGFLQNARSSPIEGPEQAHKHKHPSLSEVWSLFGSPYSTGHVNVDVDVDTDS